MPARKDSHPTGSGAGQDQPAQPGEQGRVGWHELFANDQASAFDFYAALFGWEKKESMDMGEMGVYQTFGIGDTTLGGMMNKPPEVPVANWHYYFNAGNIDEAAERVKSAGGQIVNGPMEVPGGDFILMGIDPQGAFFALLEPDAFFGFDAFFAMLSLLSYGGGMSWSSRRLRSAASREQSASTMMNSSPA